LYAEGTVVEKDVFMALLYLERAALENNPYAAYLAGKLRLTDEENRDSHRAVEHFTTAAENGNSYAEYMLGKMYLYGNGVEKDIDLALSYLNLSAEHGNEYAVQFLYNLSHSKNPSVAMAAFRLLQYLARTIQNRIDDERKDIEHMTDKKLRRKIDAKREAHGLKHG
jgi:TPR repeat protein